MAMFQPQSAQGNPPASQSVQQGAAKKKGLFAAGGALDSNTTDAINSFGTYLKNNQYNYNGAPALPGVNDFSGDRQRIEDTLYNRAKQDLDTRYNNETSAFEQRMANEGVDIGSPKYRMEKELFEKSRNEAYNDARYKAIVGGGAEQDRLFDNALAARKQLTGEEDSLRTARVNDLAALLSPAVTANNASTTERIASNERDFKKKENEKDRKLKREEIRKSGGSDALDLPTLIGLIETLTGEKLSG